VLALSKEPAAPVPVSAGAAATPGHEVTIQFQQTATAQAAGPAPPPAVAPPSGTTTTTTAWYHHEVIHYHHRLTVDYSFFGAINNQ